MLVDGVWDDHDLGINDGGKEVPHLAARALRDADQLDLLLAAYTSRCGVNEVLVVGGGGRRLERDRVGLSAGLR